MGQERTGRTDRIDRTGRLERTDRNKKTDRIDRKVIKGEKNDGTIVGRQVHKRNGSAGI